MEILRKMDEAIVVHCREPENHSAAKGVVDLGKLKAGASSNSSSSAGADKP